MNASNNEFLNEKKKTVKSNFKLGMLLNIYLFIQERK